MNPESFDIITAIHVESIAKVLAPLGWTYMERSNITQHATFHSPYAGDVDFSCVHKDNILKYAQQKIFEAGKMEGRNSIRRQFADLLTLEEPAW